MPDQAAGLQALLLGNPELLQRYVLCTQIHAAVEKSLWSLLPGADELAPAASRIPSGMAGIPASAAAQRPSTPNLGFFTRVFQTAGRSPLSSALAWLFILLCSGVVVGGIAAIGLFMDRGGGRFARSRPAAGTAASPLVRATVRPPDGFVAELTRLVHCRWTGSLHSPEAGNRFAAGRELDLAGGVAEIRFDRGVKVVLQGPACIQVTSAIAMRLKSGKITAEILRPEARGFQVQTPKGKVVDLGTEFGVEVTPVDDVKVHVFKGEVVVQQDSGADGRHLLRDQGLRMESGTALPLLVEESGETFIRTIDDADRDRHVVAYWRFEDHPVGDVVPDTSSNKKRVRGTVDSSFNGNDLFTYSAASRPRFSGDVPPGAVLQSGAANRGCLDNTVPPVEDAPTRDLYTRSLISHAAPIDIQKVKLQQWTVEASVKAKVLNVGSQTFVGRDGGKNAVMAFKINPQDHFEIYFSDVKYHSHKAVTKWRVRRNQWYHLAAVSDGKTLRLYVDAHDGRGYQLCSSSNLQPERGSTVLGPSNPNAEWSVGRGRLNRLTCEWFQGWIDEVRICDVALPPGEFLFAPAASPAPPAVVTAAKSDAAPARDGDCPANAKASRKTTDQAIAVQQVIKP